MSKLTTFWVELNTWLVKAAFVLLAESSLRRGRKRMDGWLVDSVEDQWRCESDGTLIKGGAILSSYLHHLPQPSHQYSNITPSCVKIVLMLTHEFPWPIFAPKILCSVYIYNSCTPLLLQYLLPYAPATHFLLQYVSFFAFSFPFPLHLRIAYIIHECQYIYPVGYAVLSLDLISQDSHAICPVWPLAPSLPLSLSLYSCHCSSNPSPP